MLGASVIWSTALVDSMVQIHYPSNSSEYGEIGRRKGLVRCPVTLLRAALRFGTKNPSELIHIGSSPIIPTNIVIVLTVLIGFDSLGYVGSVR